MNRRVTKELRGRSFIAFAFLCLGLLVVIGNLFWVSVIHGEEYKLKAERQQMSDTVLTARRGSIYDSNMKVLAQSASAYLVYINPSKILTDEQKKLVVDGLGEILELDKETLENKASREDSSYEKIAGQVNQEKRDLIRKFVSENSKKGLNEIIGIDADTKRYYPLDSFASTVLGFTGTGDTGRSGLELFYNDQLTGSAGRSIAAKNAQAQSMASDYEQSYAATDGYSLVLTVDEVIQYYLEQQLGQALEETGAKYAYGIVMDVQTGAILGMSTMPDYNLNEPYKIASQSILDSINELETGEEKSRVTVDAQFEQWRNRGISDSFESGSTFKLFVAAAGLEEGIISDQSTFTCTSAMSVANYTYHCYHSKAHGVQSLHQALPNSCNTFFITLGQKLGKEKFFKYFEAFGFTQKTGIDLPAEATPVEGATYYGLKGLGPVQLASSSFGQSFQITPVQLLTAVASFGNGGKLMTPYLVSKVLDSDGNIVSETKPTLKRQVVSESTANTIASLMEEVVIGGTAKNAYVSGYHVCGKTGTSDKLTSDGQVLASFVGFAPKDNPRIAVLITIDEPQVYGASTGGSAAAPVAGRVFDTILQYMNIDPEYEDSESGKSSATVPNLVGKTPSEAKNVVSKYTVHVVGEGEEVVSQIPAPGQSIEKGGVIVLYTSDDAERLTGKVPDLTGLTVSEAKRIAISAGFNIKITGLTQSSSDAVSYKQSIEAGSTGELGSSILVYFKSTDALAD